MKLLKIETDKLLHYLVGVSVIALVLPYGCTIMWIIFLLFLILSFYKEYKIDSTPELIDIVYYIAGSLTAAINHNIANLII